jgi:hypothetical protein
LDVLEQVNAMTGKEQYREGAIARKEFEKAMKAAFQIPKEKAPAKPKPKRRKPSGKGEG